MSAKRRKDQEQYDRKFALYQQLQEMTGKEYSIEQSTSLFELSIPAMKRLIKEVRLALERLATTHE